MTDSQPTNDSEKPEPQQTPTEPADESPSRRILIGSQRDPGAYKPKPQRDWKGLSEDVTAEEPSAETPADEAPAGEAATSEPAAGEPATGDAAPVETSPVEATAETAAPTVEAPAEPIAEAPIEQPELEETSVPSLEEEAAELGIDIESIPAGRIPPPSVRDKLAPDLQEELDDAFADTSMDDLMATGSEELSKQEMLEEESRQSGRVVALHGDDVFVELGSREQGVASLKQFPEEPEVGAELEVIVLRFNKEDGLYELGIPNAAANVSDWSDLHEGMLVDARITGHNTGGLECEVNHIRGFIPVSQISLFRVEDLAQFVDEKFTCVVTEANPQRGNLVLSRRSVLEREKEEAREKLMESLEPGQIHDGVVRKIMDFGAFVDIGGVDGLLHISQLAWHRVEHPSEILHEGQAIKVKVEKIDKATGKIGFGYRDMLTNPWDDAESKYPVNSVVQGTVKKLMEFGAFVEVEPGVEGLVHISELSHKRLWRVSDAVHEGDTVDVLVQSVDSKAQRMSLSMKATLPEPVTEKKAEDSEIAELPAEAKKKSNKPSKPLKGGVGRSSGGEKFGLKW